MKDVWTGRHRRLLCLPGLLIPLRAAQSFLEGCDLRLQPDHVLVFSAKARSELRELLVQLGDSCGGGVWAAGGPISLYLGQLLCQHCPPVADAGLGVAVQAELLIKLLQGGQVCLLLLG